jgi:hypothetical protein
MAMSWLFLLGLALSLFFAIIIMYQGKINQQGEPASESFLDSFFSDDYFAARALFLQSAEKAGAEILSLPVFGTLSTDVAVLRGFGKPEKFLIHLSGIHGVETYAGSAIQSLALEYISQYRKTNIEIGRKNFPTIVFVHAVNPYGFANNRRVNEDNIDVNRNFLTQEEFAAVQARSPNYAGYVDLDSLINPREQISSVYFLNDIYNTLQTLYAMSRYGLIHMKRALVSGNYHKANGVGFGGKSQSKSVKNIIELVQGEWMGLAEAEAEEVILIDVHTGLGPSGIDTIDSNNSPDVLHQTFPTEYDYGAPSLSVAKGTGDTAVTGGIHHKSTKGTATDSGALSGYDLTIGMTSSLCDNWLSQGTSRDKVTCIIQEFGTVNLITVGKNMISENFAHFFGSEHDKHVYGKRYRDCFYVQTKLWKHNVARRGLIVVLQAIHKLGVKFDDLPLPTQDML